MVHGDPEAWEIGIPTWERPARRVMHAAVERARVIGTCTPTNLTSELPRLTEDFAAGREREPHFTYRPVPARALVDLLQRLARELDEHGEPLANVYAERARELALELLICEHVGTPAMPALAQQRYGHRDEFDRAADALCQEWVLEPAEAQNATIVSSDEGDCRSLLCRMREVVGQRRLPVRVDAVADLSALAATGDGVVYVAKGRRVSEADVERTVLHEIEGHVMPDCHARQHALAIFTLGTRHGSDDQEGRALRLEALRGHLSSNRRRELAWRHHACQCMARSATFVDTVRSLRDYGADLPTSLRITARAYRGGGLGRERVYLGAYLRVANCSEDAKTVMASGRVAVPTTEILQPHVLRCR